MTKLAASLLSSSARPRQGAGAFHVHALAAACAGLLVAACAGAPPPTAPVKAATEASANAPAPRPPAAAAPAESREAVMAAAKAKRDAGDHAGCAALWEKAASMKATSVGSHVEAAACHVLAGDRDAAFAALTRATENGLERPTIEARSELAPLRADPRWPALLAALEANAGKACPKLAEAAATAPEKQRFGLRLRAASCYVSGGAADPAFAELRAAITASGPEARDLLFLPLARPLWPLRADPRWPAIVDLVVARAAALWRLEPQLLAIYLEDQAARIGPRPTFDEASDARRRRRVEAILAAGGARTADDHYHAAMVFQHGGDVAAYRRAHELCLKAVELDPEHRQARWLAAASLDRELMHLGRPQKYGTQYRQRAGGPFELYQVDPTTTDEERARWNVPPLAEARRRAAEMGKLAPPTPAAPASPRPAP
jgi:hypothetical protein